MPVALADGGVNGGGGGTLPAEHITPSEVFEIVQNSKMELRLLSQGLLWMYNPNAAMPYEAKLFAGTPNLLDVLETTQVEVRMSEPCYNSSHGEVDGSIYASLPHAICISASRIAPKLIPEIAHREIQALILHELSHLLGTSEDEAVDFQRSVAYWIKSSQSRGNPEQWVEETFRSLQSTTGTLWGLMDKIDSLSGDEVVQWLGRANIQNVIRYEMVPYSLFNQKQIDFDEIQEARIALLVAYARTNSETQDPMGMEKEEYLKAFAQDEVISADTCLKRGAALCLMVMRGNQYQDEKLSKIHNRAELKAQLKAIQEYLWDMETWVASYRFGGPLIDYRGPWSANMANPWQSFVGSYQVTAADCDEAQKPSFRDSLLTLAVTSKEEGLYLDLAWQGMSSSQPLLDGSSGGVGHMHLTGDANSATLTEQSGNFWAQRMDRREVRLVNAGDHYEMTETVFHRTWLESGLNESTQVCRYLLKKIVP